MLRVTELNVHGTRHATGIRPRAMPMLPGGKLTASAWMPNPAVEKFCRCFFFTEQGICVLKKTGET
ncbi:MAG: hypothetical protein ACYDBL_02580 [Candidatus Acidiferrales bacterium]